MAEERNALVDYGRFLAALGLVWFDSQAAGNRIAYLAVPVFLILLIQPISLGLAEKAQRLLRPFLVWSLVFALVHIVFAIKTQDPLFGWWEWHMLLTGTWIHLWLLPFAFLAAMLSPWFQHPLASMGAALLAATLLSLEGAPEDVPFGQWSFGLIPVLVGIAFFAWGWRLAVVTLLLSWAILQFGRPSPDNITILIGTALALVGLSYRLPSTPVSEWCGRLAMWIYLSHPLAIIVGQSLRITWVELALFSIVGSVMLAQLLDLATRTPRRELPELS